MSAEKFTRRYLLKAFMFTCGILSLASPVYAFMTPWYERLLGLTTMIALTGFLVSFILSIVYLVKKRKEAKKDFAGDTSSSERLDKISLRSIVAGTLMLIPLIIYNAIWANSILSTYLGWNPANAWALFLWITYAALLIARRYLGLVEKRFAVTSIAAFVITVSLYCWLLIYLYSPLYY